MATKRSSKKKPARVVTDRERDALAQHRSLMRSSRVLRRVRSAARQLDVLQRRALDDLIELSRKILTDAGFTVERQAASE